MPGPKETAYDDMVSPLVSEIIRLCKEHKIATFMRFVLDPDDGNPDDPLLCTTLMPVSEEDGDNEHVIRCNNADGPQFTAFTVTTKREETA